MNRFQLSRGYLSRQHLSVWHLSISGICQLGLTMTICWPNFKGRFLEQTLTDANRYGDICPVNICPGDICPYQEYISYYCLNSDQTLKVDYKKKVNFNFFVNIILPKFLYSNVFLCPMFFWTPIFFGPNFFLNLKFFNLNVLDKLFIYQNLFGSNTFWP